MNTIVLKHVSASRLPEDMREGINPADHVTVTIEIERPGAQADFADTLRTLLAAARRGATIEDDPVDRVRSLRDEWDR